MTLSSAPQAATESDDAASGGNSFPAKAPQSPGRMQPAAGTMQLSTKIGHGMWQGRRASGQGKDSVHDIVGAGLFARNCSGIWRAAMADDPYADNALLEIESAYLDAMQSLDSQIKSLTELIESGMSGIALSPQGTDEPLVVELSFHNPWGYRGASLVKKFDDLAVLALTAKSVGLFFESDWKSSVYRVGTKIRRTFDLSRMWLHTGVTRDDIKANNETARRAVEIYTQKHKDKMLAIEEDVLTGEFRAELSPRITAKPSD